MTYPGAIALLLCSVSVMVIGAILPLLTAEQREPVRRHLPLWVWGAGAVFFLTALVAFRRAPASALDDITVVFAPASMLLGLALKWFLDLLARKPYDLHAATPAKALLFAPWVPVLFANAFGSVSSPRSLLLWFANGFFWLTVVGDFERMLEPEHVIVRRREPPEPAALPANYAPSASSPGSTPPLRTP